MKKLSFLPLLLWTASTLWAQKPGALDKTVYELREAVEKKFVSIELRGLGGHTGEAVEILCKNIRGKQVKIKIPAGLFLEPADSSMQRLVNASEHLLTLTAQKPQKTRLSTYCTQMGDRSPTESSVFALGVMAPQPVVELLQFISEKKTFDAGDCQAAVWCLTNKAPLGAIGNTELKQFAARLAGKQAPPYRIRYAARSTTLRPGEPADLGAPAVVEGNFEYIVEKEITAVMALYDAEGRHIKDLSKPEKLVAGEHKSGFTLKLYNLPPGRYEIRLQTTADKRIIRSMPVEF